MPGMLNRSNSHAVTPNITQANTYQPSADGSVTIGIEGH